jgi:hypothetical protein
MNFTKGKRETILMIEAAVDNFSDEYGIIES